LSRRRTQKKAKQKNKTKLTPEVVAASSLARLGASAQSASFALLRKPDKCFRDKLLDLHILIYTLNRKTSQHCQFFCTSTRSSLAWFLFYGNLSRNGRRRDAGGSSANLTRSGAQQENNQAKGKLPAYRPFSQLRSTVSWPSRLYLRRSPFIH